MTEGPPDAAEVPGFVDRGSPSTRDTTVALSVSVTNRTGWGTVRSESPLPLSLSLPPSFPSFPSLPSTSLRSPSQTPT